MKCKIIMNYFNIYLGDNDFLSISCCVISSKINNISITFGQKLVYLVTMETTM